MLTHNEQRNAVLLDYTAAHGIETQTHGVRSETAYGQVRDFRPDVLFSLYYRDIIPQRILDVPPLGCVNLHPSLLPKYRGTFSSAWAIINGEADTGITYHRMVPAVDAGNIILQRRVPTASNDTAYSLYHRLIIEGMSAFDLAFHLVVEERYPGEPQVGEPSYYPRQLPFRGYVDPKWDRKQIDRFIRAMWFPPFKGACVRLRGGTEQEVRSLAEYEALVAGHEVEVC